MDEKICVMRMVLRTSLGKKRSMGDWGMIAAGCLLFVLYMAQAGAEDVAFYRFLHGVTAAVWLGQAILMAITTRPSALTHLPPMTIDDAKLFRRHLDEAITRAEAGEEGVFTHAA